MKWVFKKEARDEFRQIYTWYDEQSFTVEDQFIDEFGKLIEVFAKTLNAGLLSIQVVFVKRQ